MKIARILIVVLLTLNCHATTSVTFAWQASKTPKTTYWIYSSKNCTGVYTRRATTKNTTYTYAQAKGTFCYYVVSYLKTTSALSNIVTFTATK